MTDRLSGFIVVLEHTIRDDDAEQTIQAIKQIKGVLTVEPVVADGIAEHTARAWARHQMSRRLYELAESFVRPEVV